MYEKFFGFSETPFSLTPDPKFFYGSHEHEEALSHILFGIQERRGFIVISGEVGTGKTTLCRHVLAKLDPKVKTALIFNPNLTTLELLRTINQDFGLVGEGKTKKELVDELNAFLLDALAKGGNAFLVIDEAQNLPIECLEEIRMLSNLETTKEKLMQILLLGQPELRDKLQLKELRQLNQRVALRYHLEALTFEETRSYIAHRIRTAGGDKSLSFSDAAVRRIHEASGGIPRLINITCDKVLLAAFVAETKTIDPRLVKDAVKELSDRPGDGTRRRVGGPGAWSPLARWGTVAAAAAFVAVGIVVAYPDGARFLLRDRSFPVRVALSKAPAISRPFSPVKDEPSIPFSFDAHGVYRVTAAPDSGPAAALTLLRRWGVPGVGQTQDDLNALRDRDFEQWVGEMGFSVFRFSADLQKIRLLGYPVIVALGGRGPGGERQEKQWVVLSRLDDEGAALLDPLAGERRLMKEELAASLEGNAILIWRPLNGVSIPFKETNKESVKALQRLLQEKGFFQGDPTGRWDEASARAIRFLQQKAGLPENGLLTTESHIVLSRIIQRDRIPSLADGA